MNCFQEEQIHTKTHNTGEEKGVWIQWNGNSGIVEWLNGGMVEWMHVLYQVHFWCMLAIAASE